MSRDKNSAEKWRKIKVFDENTLMFFWKEPIGFSVGKSKCHINKPFAYTLILRARTGKRRFQGSLYISFSDSLFGLRHIPLADDDISAWKDLLF
jgi:hypothetical protein